MPDTAETLIIPPTSPDAGVKVPPPQGRAKKKSNKWILIISVLLIFLTLPVVIYFVSQYQQSTDVRSRASGMVCKLKSGAGAPCSTVNCASKTTEPACTGVYPSGCCVWGSSGGGGGTNPSSPASQTLCNRTNPGGGISCPLSNTTKTITPEGGTNGCTSWGSWSDCVSGPGAPYEYWSKSECLAGETSGQTIVAWAGYACSAGGGENTPTITGEPTATTTAEPTVTSTGVPTATPTNVPTATETPTPTNIPNATNTPTSVPTSTPTGTYLADATQQNATPTNSAQGQDVPVTGIGPGFIGILTVVGSVFLLLVGLAL